MVKWAFPLVIWQSSVEVAHLTLTLHTKCKLVSELASELVSEPSAATTRAMTAGHDSPGD